MMKNHPLLLAVVLALGITVSVPAQSSSFTYQGSLANGGSPATGTHNMSFTLKDAATGGATIGSPVNLTNIPVSDGVFTVELDFGATAFNGGDRWLEIAVGGSTLLPRQKVSAVPYSLNTRGISVEESGKVGFGTDNPLRDLHLHLGNSGATIRDDSFFLVERDDTAYATIATPHDAWSGWIFSKPDNPVAGGMLYSRDRYLYLYGNSNTSMTIDPSSRVGLGTGSPEAKLHVVKGTTASQVSEDSTLVLESDDANYLTFKSQNDKQAGLLFGSSSSDSDGALIYNNSNDSMYFVAGTSNGTAMMIDGQQRVGIGTFSPQGGLSVANTSEVIDPTSQGVHMGRIPIYTSDTAISIVAASGGGAQLRFYEQGGGNCRLWYQPTDDVLKFDGSGLTKVSVPVLEIRGGADIVEGFDSVDDMILEPGTVVSIDPDSPGALMRSTESYDRKVAGIVSGANGVNPGMHLGQDGVLDGDTKVAMTGRVYVRATDENGLIRPGDRLTSSSLPGYAMRATDSQRSDGAVIGKAMTPLDEATGLVLVLVNLQ